MNKLLIIIVFLPFTLFGQSTNEITKAVKLKEYYIKSSNNEDSIKYQKLYFDIFPDNFNDFNAIFGYFDDTLTTKSHEGPLYDGHDEISFFFALESIPEETFYLKIINIALGGHWEADAINYFQNGLRSKVLLNPRLTFDILKYKSDRQIESFFFFFFQSIHPVFESIPDQFVKLKTYDSRIYGLIESGFDKALKQSGH